MFFVPVHTPPLAPPLPATDPCSRDNFWTTCWNSFIFRTIVGLALWIIWLDFGRFSSWSWHSIFKVRYAICYISTKNGLIATKWKANISIELKASNVTIRFDLGTWPWIFKVKCDLDRWPHTWALTMDSCISEWEGWLTLNKGGGSR